MNGIVGLSGCIQARIKAYFYVYTHRTAGPSNMCTQTGM
uniref:Uncharacterized protein n=1 Tax=Anguilla anguilla TaxID=7936 RepID=A0A0E9R5N9_ANGAN